MFVGPSRKEATQQRLKKIKILLKTHWEEHEDGELYFVLTYLDGRTKECLA